MSRARHPRGFSLIEAILALTVLSFVVIATATMLEVGLRQQRLGRSYSNVQNDLRDALRRATRGVRHAFGVVASSNSEFGSAVTSGPSQVIVQLPQAGASRLNVRYYLSGTTLYFQKAGEAAPGTALITGVNSFSLSYYRTIGTVRTATDGTPSNATEIAFRLTATSGSATTPVETLVLMRNRLAGSL